MASFCDRHYVYLEIKKLKKILLLRRDEKMNKIDQNEKVKIFFVNKFPWVNNAPMSTVSTMMCHALATLGHEVYLYIEGDPSIDKDQTLQSWFNLKPLSNLHIRLIPRNRKGKKSKFAFGFYFRVFKELMALSKSKEAMISITRNTHFLPFLLLFKRFKGARVFFESHGYHGKNVPGYKTNFMYWLWERLSIHKLDGLVCLTKTQEKLYKETKIKTPIITLPLGSPLPKYNPLPSFSNKTIVYIGRLTYQIDYPTVMKAFSKLNDSRIRLLWIGLNQEDSKRLYDCARQEGVENQISTMEWKSHGDLQKILVDQCSVGLACYVDNFQSALISPTKLFDYYSLGLPVIAPQISTMEFVLNDTVEGLTYKPENPDSLASAIKQIFSDEEDYKRMQKNAFNAALKFSWNNRAENFVSFANQRR